MQAQFDLSVQFTSQKIIGLELNYMTILDLMMVLFVVFVILRVLQNEVYLSNKLKAEKKMIQQDNI